MARPHLGVLLEDREEQHHSLPHQQILILFPSSSTSCRGQRRGNKMRGRPVVPQGWGIIPARWPRTTDADAPKEEIEDVKSLAQRAKRWTAAAVSRAARKSQGLGVRLMPSGSQGKVENKSGARRQGTYLEQYYKHRNWWTLSPALRFSDDCNFFGIYIWHNWLYKHGVYGARQGVFRGCQLLASRDQSLLFQPMPLDGTISAERKTCLTLEKLWKKYFNLWWDCELPLS